MTYIHTVFPSCREIFVLQVRTSHNNTNVLGSGLGYLQASEHSAEIKGQFSISSIFFFCNLGRVSVELFRSIDYIPMLEMDMVSLSVQKSAALSLKMMQIFELFLNLYIQYISTRIKQFIHWSIFWNWVCKLIKLQGWPCQSESS